MPKSPFEKEPKRTASEKKEDVGTGGENSKFFLLLLLALLHNRRRSSSISILLFVKDGIPALGYKGGTKTKKMIFYKGKMNCRKVERKRITFNATCLALRKTIHVFTSFR